MDDTKNTSQSVTHKKTLIFMRHAHASFNAGRDIARPLTHKGKEQALELAISLNKVGIIPEHFLCSPAARTQETQSILADYFSKQSKAILVSITRDKLYDASMGEILEIIQGLPSKAEMVAIVGHNPSISQIVNFLFDGQGAFDEMGLSIFPPASCAVLEWSGPEGEELHWSDIQPSSFKLRHFITPQ